MRNQATSITHTRARALRSGMTDSERKLWSRLRQEQMGVKFRRQHPLGHYIADFACLAPKLIVELDGSQHAEHVDYDARRDAFFRDQGFSILRFASNEPLMNIDGVLIVIAEQLDVARRRPHPNLPPEGEGARKNQES